MFRFLKDLMKSDKAPAYLGLSDLPAWIDGEEEKVRQDLASRAGAARAVLRDARSRMEEVLSGFDTGSMEEAPHPKLAGVTERSLPLFLKAMRASLARELPGDPEGFYAAAGEILKGCLSAFRGQGRYLASRFPEEMKVLRTGVDTMGREVNALTPDISRARSRLRGLADLRESVRKYGDARHRASVGLEEIGSLEEGIRAAGVSLERVRQGLAELEKGEEYQAYQGELARIRSLETDRDEAARAYRAAAATAIHLFRKGEKIVSRKKDRDALRVLQQAADLLGRDLPVPGDSVSGTVPPAQKVIAALAASGDLTPKNREEIDLVENPGHLVQGLAGISRKFHAISGEIASAQGDIISRPALVKSRDLVKEREELEKRIAQGRNQLELAGKEMRDLEAGIKASLGEIHTRVRELSENRIRIQEPEPSPGEGEER